MHPEKCIFTIFLLAFFQYTFSQTGNIAIDKVNYPEYQYRSAENPYYWKNRAPYAGYWQQDVQYQINAELDDLTDIITGDLTLTYYNNSNDTLPFVYFHLYQEAFQPNSYLSNLNEVNDNEINFGNYESEGLGIEVEQIQIKKINGFPCNDSVEMMQDNTILKVQLKNGVLPHGSITFSIQFKTYFDSSNGLRRRMKMFDAFGNKHFDGVHWYPRICVYDRKFGWATDQHLGKEFYGDFGSYEVNLTLPAHYIIDATGVLINPETALPKSLREKLDIKNFENKPYNSAPSIVIENIPGEKKMWKFYAMNVHDFAFTADPTYRISEDAAIVNGKLVRVVALVQEPHAAGWKNAASYTKKIIETNSKYFGNYIWPKIIVADARDGMEYPMLTLDGGSDPSYRGLLVHEVSHMWFFGMVGNNETYRASLDEGFTQFLTAFTLEKIDGPTPIKNPINKKYTAKYKEEDDVVFNTALSGYLYSAQNNLDMPLNTHSDDFNSALGHGGGYGLVYRKTATMLYNLQYVLGDTLFQNAMIHYMNEWKLCHPYFEDFRNSIIHFTHVDLNWFFDQWLETTKTIDYSIAQVNQKKSTNLDGQILYPYTITFHRKGEMQMPLDFIVITENEDTISYHIPNTWFNKYENQIIKNNGLRLNGNQFSQVTILPKWTGWGLLNMEYVAEIILPSKVKNILIDPTNRLADIYKLDNNWRCPIDLKFDAHINNTSDWNHYTMKWRPDIWYNTIDVAKVGIHLNGNYMNYKHIIEFTAWFNTGSLDNGLKTFAESTELRYQDAQYVSFDFNYKTSTDRFLKNSNFFFDTKLLDGIYGFKIGEDIILDRNAQHKVSVFYNDVQYLDANYLMYGDQVLEQKNNAVHIQYEHKYQYEKGSGKLKLGFRSDDIISDYDYQYLNLEEINETQIGKFDLKTRFFVQWGSGTNIPFESSLMLAGANQETLLENKYTRAVAFFPQTFQTFSSVTNHFHAGGGLNLRGYAGYLVAEQGADSNVYAIYSGSSGGSISAELEFDRIVKKQVLKFVKMTPYLFYDIGTIAYEASGKNSLSAIRMDAGIGTTFSWTWWGQLQSLEPLTLRIDFPLFLNRAPYAESDFFKFRYVIGINRSF